MDALILSAGDGTRLYPITKNKPKSMIKIYGIPILERSLHALKMVGVKRVVIVIGHKGEMIEKYFGNKWKGMEIIYKKTDYYEDGILKSAILGKDVIKNRFIFLHGDTIVEENLLRRALEKEGDMVISIRNSENDSVCAEVSHDGMVKNIGMKKEMKVFNASVAGISVSDTTFFDAIQECIQMEKFDRPEAIKQMLKKGYKINSFEILDNDFFLEIDTLEDLKNAKRVIFDNAVKARVPRPGLFKKLFNFPISFPLTKLLANTCLGPNHITLISLLIFIVAGIFFSLKQFIIGGILCYFGAMFDAVDGKISRLKLKSSYTGKILDYICDRFCELITVIGLTCGIYFLTHQVYIWILGILCIFFLVGRYYVQGVYFELIGDRIHNSKRWRGSISSNLVRLSNRDLNFFIILISCLIGYPIIGLGYMAFSASLAFFIRLVQTMKTMEELDNSE